VSELSSLDHAISWYLTTCTPSGGFDNSHVPELASAGLPLLGTPELGAQLAESDWFTIEAAACKTEMDSANVDLTFSDVNACKHEETKDVDQLLNELLPEVPDSPGGIDDAVPTSPVLPPEPTVKRRKKQTKVPANKRDERYTAYRKKNTQTAKAIRDRKRHEKEEKKRCLSELKQRQVELKQTVLSLEEKLAALKARFGPIAE